MRVRRLRRRPCRGAGGSGSDRLGGERGGEIRFGDDRGALGAARAGCVHDGFDLGSESRNSRSERRRRSRETGVFTVVVSDAPCVP